MQEQAVVVATPGEYSIRKFATCSSAAPNTRQMMQLPLQQTREMTACPLDQHARPRDQAMHQSGVGMKGAGPRTLAPPVKLDWAVAAGIDDLFVMFDPLYDPFNPLAELANGV